MMFAHRRISKRNKRLRELVMSTGQQAYHLALQYTYDPDSAKDILQQSLLKVLEKYSLPSEGLNYWFLKIVRNTALDYVRHQATKTRLADEIKNHQKHIMEMSTNSPEKVERQIKTRSLIEQCLNNLSTEHREIIVLKDLHDYNYEQISKILDIAKGTVMSRLYRARLALKNEVLKHESL